MYFLKSFIHNQPNALVCFGGILVDNEISDTGKTSPTLVTMWSRPYKWPGLQVHTLKQPKNSVRAITSKCVEDQNMQPLRYAH
jgi:hypothetical protein